MRILIVALLFVFFGCQNANNKLLEEKVAQMLMVGFRGTEVDASSNIVNDIKTLGIGGVILYEYDAPTKSRPRNISSKKQLKQLNETLQHFSKVPLFIGIDEEGGLVSRLKPKYGFLPTVSPQYMGEFANLDTTQFYAERIAMACQSVGINLNFAPLVDINVNTQCPVIGKLKRSFSSHADSVILHAQTFVQAHNKLGVACSLKHFPGHGSAKTDSHKGFTDVSETWTERELIPYRELINLGVCPMVMTAHVFNKNIDSVYPATLSKNTLALLRDSMNYDGLVLSDDMMMLAIADHFGLDEALEKAINAGVDVLLFSNNIDHYDANIASEVIQTIVGLVKTGKIAEERINESYQRIMRHKTMLK